MRDIYATMLLLRYGVRKSRILNHLRFLIMPRDTIDGTMNLYYQIDEAFVKNACEDIRLYICFNWHQLINLHEAYSLTR